VNPALWVLGLELVSHLDDGRPQVAQEAPLTAWVGQDRGRLMLTGALGVDMERTSVSSEEGSASSLEGALRPRVGARWYLAGPRSADLGSPIAFLVGDLGGAIPFVHERSDAFSDEEQAAWDEESASSRARIGAMETRVGVGAELQGAHGLSIGLVGRLGATWGWEADGDVHSASVRLRSHAALVAGLQL
jgi:hypothetical protein